MPGPLLFPPPPRTSNNLQPEERRRLLRSTRKLGAILGSTPHLPDVPVSGRERPTLLLHVHGDYDNDESPLPSPDFHPPSNRDSVTEQSLIVAERRNKLAKLARQLGEQVPPELVFSPVSSINSPLDTPISGGPAGAWGEGAIRIRGYGSQDSFRPAFYDLDHFERQRSNSVSDIQAIPKKPSPLTKGSWKDTIVSTSGNSYCFPRQQSASAVISTNCFRSTTVDSPFDDRVQTVDTSVKNIIDIRPDFAESFIEFDDDEDGDVAGNREKPEIEEDAAESNEGSAETPRSPLSLGSSSAPVFISRYATASSSSEPPSLPPLEFPQWMDAFTGVFTSPDSDSEACSEDHGKYTNSESPGNNPESSSDVGSKSAPPSRFKADVLPIGPVTAPPTKTWAYRSNTAPTSFDSLSFLQQHQDASTTKVNRNISNPRARPKSAKHEHSQSLAVSSNNRRARQLIPFARPSLFTDRPMTVYDSRIPPPFRQEDAAYPANSRNIQNLLPFGTTTFI